MDLETKIAQAHEPSEQSDDFKNGAQVWTRAAARAEGAGDRLGRAADAARLGGAQKFDAYHFAAIPKLAALVGVGAAAELEGLAGLPHDQPAGQRASASRSATRASPSTARCLPERRSSGRATRCALNATSNQLQDAVGKAYVDKYFPASSKTQIQAMVDNIKAAFARRSRRSAG